MPRSRIATALDQGLILPPGDIEILRPPAAMDLSALPRERVVIRHTFRPDRDAWEAAGYRIADAMVPEAGLALACVPRSKALARHLIAEASRASSLVLVDGQREDGVDSLWREVRERVPEAEGLAQGHGRLFWFPSPGAGPDGRSPFADWAMEEPVRGPDGLYAQPGVFSADGADPGSLLLARALPARLPARMADLGAGIGVLSLAALAREGVESIELIEAEFLALDCARLNIKDPRAAFRWADVPSLPPAPEWDGIVMNPPFHGAARAPDPALGRAFIAAAARGLAPHGQLWLVANRHLPYEAALAEAFREVAVLGGDGGFKLIHAAGPKGRRSRDGQVAREGRGARAPSAGRGSPRSVTRDGRARRQPAG